jgi:hypothetical protein
MGIFLATAASVGVGRLQWSTLEKTDQTLRLQQRAWIAPHHPVLPAAMNQGDPFSYAIFYGNTGKEPAVNIVIDQREEVPIFFKDTPSLDAIFGRNEIKKYNCEAVHPNPDGFGAFPTRNPELTYEVNTHRPLPSEAEIRAGNRFLLIKGCFGYETLKEPHYSWFCYFWPNINSPTLWKLCPGGTNGAD